MSSNFTKHDVMKEGQMKVKLTSMTFKAHQNNLGLFESAYEKVGHSHPVI